MKPGTDGAAHLLVIGEVQLDRAVERDAAPAQRLQGKGIGREIGFGDGDAAAVHDAVLHERAVRIDRPAFARRHDIAMGVERDHLAARSESLAHDEVRGADHAVRPHEVVGDVMTFDLEPQRLEKPGRALRMRLAIAGRIVGRDLDQLAEEAGLLVAIGLYGIEDELRGVRLHARSRLRAHLR